MPDLGLVFACTGCCCGHADRGGLMAPHRALKAAARRVYERSGLAGRVRLAFTDCLGPCSEANVVFVYLHGRPLWFRRVNSPELFGVLLEYVRTTVDDPSCALPRRLGAHSFSWTGGGVGPEPAADAAVLGAAEMRR
ncbi:MAG: (2Fe-2S) ferredoxin domain-containing protein [Candidatus Rokubacteria bacterium]|nr:(2Fe-2S) ferredoxin domain-containing protein [Candidatus Rokubacteria bacterium]